MSRLQYTAIVLGKAGALDDLMTRTQALCLRIPWHRNVAYVDPRVLGMRVPLGLEDALPAEGVCPAEGLANRHSLPARRPSREVPMLYAVAMLASVAHHVCQFPGNIRELFQIWKTERPIV